MTLEEIERVIAAGIEVRKMPGTGMTIVVIPGLDPQLIFFGPDGNGDWWRLKDVR